MKTRFKRIMELPSSDSSEDEESQCIVCLTSVSETEKTAVRSVTTSCACEYVVHANCLTTWLETKARPLCMICRTPMQNFCDVGSCPSPPAPLQVAAATTPSDIALEETETPTDTHNHCYSERCALACFLCYWCGRFMMRRGWAVSL